MAFPSSSSDQLGLGFFLSPAVLITVLIGVVSAIAAVKLAFRFNLTAARHSVRWVAAAKWLEIVVAAIASLGVWIVCFSKSYSHMENKLSLVLAISFTQFLINSAIGTILVKNIEDAFSICNKSFLTLIPFLVKENYFRVLVLYLAVSAISSMVQSYLPLIFPGNVVAGNAVEEIRVNGISEEQ